MPKPNKIPSCPDVSKQPSPGLLVTREYHIRLITPLFGGGVEPGENDPAFPIRETSIRGHLQFWWRATRGAAFSDLDAMRSRHAAVWGTTDRRSPIVVQVLDVKIESPVPCAEHRHDPQMNKGRGGYRLRWLGPFAQTDLPYALFPFQGKPPSVNTPGAPSEKQPARCIPGSAFVVRLQFPDELATDVDAAVWAWTNFGGLGARTRRGCGALWSSDFAPSDAGRIASWYADKQTAYGLSAPPTEPLWPVLPSFFLYRRDSIDPVTAWSKLMSLWKKYRQGQGFARNAGGKTPGRSRYPEPETIRESTQKRSHLHARLPEIPADAFPRAELGLPMVFHFQGRGEPPDATLYPIQNGKRKDRMTSPLILKPLALADGRAIPIVLCLVTSGVSEVELTAWDEGTQREASLGAWGLNAIRDPRLATYPNSPLAGSANGSAIEAFLAFAQVPVSQSGPGYEETK